jgi:hypothetical protein
MPPINAALAYRTMQVARSCLGHSCPGKMATDLYDLLVRLVVDLYRGDCLLHIAQNHIQVLVVRLKHTTYKLEMAEWKE